MSLSADYKNFTVTAKQLGSNSCGFCEKKLEKGEEIVLKHNNIFEVSTGVFYLCLVFLYIMHLY